MVEKRFNKLGMPDIERFENYLPTAFSSELTLLQKVNKIIQDLITSNKLTNEMVDYLNNFIETYDERLYQTFEDVLSKWLKDGVLTDLIRGVVNEEVVKARTDYLGKKYVNLKERLDSEKADVVKVTTQLEFKASKIDTDNIQSQINELVLNGNGTQNLEVIQARTNKFGITFSTLKDLLDWESDNNKIIDYKYYLNWSLCSGLVQGVPQEGKTRVVTNLAYADEDIYVYLIDTENYNIAYHKMTPHGTYDNYDSGWKKSFTISKGTYFKITARNVASVESENNAIYNSIFKNIMIIKKSICDSVNIYPLWECGSLNSSIGEDDSIYVYNNRNRTHVKISFDYPVILKYKTDSDTSFGLRGYNKITNMDVGDLLSWTEKGSEGYIILKPENYYRFLLKNDSGIQPTYNRTDVELTVYKYKEYIFEDYTNKFIKYGKYNYDYKNTLNLSVVTQDNNGYRMQGLATDGTYLYYTMISSTDENANTKVIKYNLTTQEKTIVENYTYGHAGDLTYNKDKNLLICLSAYQPSTIYYINPDTLNYVSEKTNALKFGGIAYNPLTKGYFLEISNNNNWRDYYFAECDENFKIINTWKPIKNGYLMQGITCDENYIYALYAEPNIVIIYNHKGEYVGYHNVSFSGETEGIAVIGDTIYIHEDGEKKVYKANRKLMFE